MLSKKMKIRILPIFIFIAVLTLSIKVHNLFDNLKGQNKSVFSIYQSSAMAEDKDTQETDELDTVLERADNTPNIIDPASKSHGFTQSEILILQELAERREALDLRSREIDRKAVQLKVAEEEINKKIRQLQEYENKLKNLIGEYDKKEKEKIDSLVKLYSTMKPKDAARIFDTLDVDITVSLLKEMKPSVSSSILSQMRPEKAKAITDSLIGNNFNKPRE
ncbi:MAG: hypothetical protein LBL47_03790 [Lactobacillus sp.]|jgi:flagellar motility protein MotE (MotC chaperone)|nr:hypothetical protein [Lactobacillus sp.]